MPFDLTLSTLEWAEALVRARTVEATAFRELSMTVRRRWCR